MTNYPEKLLFIVNPKSGTKSKDKLSSLIEKHIDPKKFEVAIEITQYAGHAPKIVNTFLTLGYKRIVAVGGDGTINEIASALAKAKDGVLGIIPMGSGNGLARHLGIPVKMPDALEIINNPQITAIDYGKVNKHPFFCTCGVGFDAAVGHKFASHKKRGLISYLRSIIKEFRNYRPKKYKITLNRGEQKIKRKAFLVTIANAGQYGNDAYISPKADIQDGLLNVSLIRPFPKYRIFGLGYRLMAKSIDKSKYAETFEATHIEIERKRKGPAHFDGEPITLKKKIKIKVVKQGLKVMVPVTW